MTKKRTFRITYSLHNHFWSGLKLIFCLSAILCILIMLKITSPSPVAVRDRVIELGRMSVAPFTGNPKLAFLFLVRKNLPLDFLWCAFFKNAEEGAFSVYVHTQPGFVFDKFTTRCKFFYGRQLQHLVKVEWGKSSMVEAEKLLLEAALLDPANQRFILLSDSCVPLYNFSYISKYVHSSSKSFVDSFLDNGGSRYNPSMSPVLPQAKWRKGSQWIALVRKHAALVVADNIVFSIFKKYCQSKPVLDQVLMNESKQTSISATEYLLIPSRFKDKQQNCIPDEHYIPTLLSMSELEDEIERRTLTYTLWNESASNMDGNRWHPITFMFADASPERIQKIKEVDHVHYGTESRTEWCQSNHASVPCFLFARKFSSGAAKRLLSVLQRFDTAGS